MGKSSLWIIRVALTVQCLCVLAVPALVASAESPRATWLAEWVNPSSHADGLSAVAPQSEGRAIGVLKLRDGKLSFDEQVGQASWVLELSSLRRVAVSGRTLTIESGSGEAFIIAVLDQNMTLGSPKRVQATIDRALRIAGASASTDR